MGIHESAIIAKSAEIDHSCEIGPGVIIEDGVRVHAGVRLSANVCLYRGTEIGEGTVIHTGAAIGNEPQDFSYEGAETFTKIGKNNVIREYVTIHRGTQEGSSTVIGDNNFIMVQAHIGHNCVLGDNIIIAPAALLAGHVQVEKGVFISGGVVFHQFCRVGAFAMIGGFTGVNKDVPPYMIVRGPSAVRGVNLVGLKRAGFSRDTIKQVEGAYKMLFLSGDTSEEALRKIRKTFDSAEVAHFVSFVENSKRGVCKPRYNKEEYFE